MILSIEVSVMTQQHIRPPSVLPVFAKAKDVPDDTSVYGICFAAEVVSGKGSIDGATCINGLWRVQPFTEVARAKLLSTGITLYGTRVSFDSMNPFRTGGGSESDSTRLTISNLPFSYSDDAMERNLYRLGVRLRSRITMERARGPDNHLSDWKTGRRTMWIEMPSSPLPKTVKMGDFSAHLYHREMKGRDSKCYRCLETGHRAFECENDEVCLVCNKSGHRKGDPRCDLGLGTRYVGNMSNDDNNVQDIVPFCHLCRIPGHLEGSSLCDLWVPNLDDESDAERHSSGDESASDNSSNSDDDGSMTLSVKERSVIIRDQTQSDSDALPMAVGLSVEGGELNVQVSREEKEAVGDSTINRHLEVLGVPPAEEEKVLNCSMETVGEGLAEVNSLESVPDHGVTVHPVSSAVAEVTQGKKKSKKEKRKQKNEQRDQRLQQQQEQLMNAKQQQPQSQPQLLKQQQQQPQQPPHHHHHHQQQQKKQQQSTSAEHGGKDRGLKNDSRNMRQSHITNFVSAATSPQVPIDEQNKKRPLPVSSPGSEVEGNSQQRPRLDTTVDEKVV